MRRSDNQLIWNVLVVRDKSGFGYQVEADSILEAVKKAERFYKGEIVKVALAEYDQD